MGFVWERVLSLISGLTYKKTEKGVNNNNRIVVLKLVGCDVEVPVSLLVEGKGEAAT